MQGEGHCVEEATVTHYFPHRTQRWSSTFLCLRVWGKSPTHTHTHLSNRTWFLCPPETMGITVFYSPSPLSPSSSAAFGQSVDTHEHKSHHTSARSSLPLPLAIVLPLFLPLHTHRVATGQLLHHKEPAS